VQGTTKGTTKGITPSQTVGPFFKYGLTPNGQYDWNDAFTNNLVTTGAYPVWSTGGGKTSCGISDVPVTSISTCFNSYVFANNGLIASPKAFPPSSWPTGNFFPVDGKAVGFVQYNDGVGGNYQLQPTSAYKNAGTDHRDLGADIAGLEAALAGVE